MVRTYSLLVTTLFIMFFSFSADACRRDGQLCGPGGDSACCSSNCIQVDGDNNNYCGSSYDYGNGNQCNWDSDCRYDEQCRFGTCEPKYNGGGWNGGWGSCLKRGQLCGNNDSACCSGDCVQVDGSNNNFCR